MAVLSEGQRRSLEKAVQRARDIAEEGARAAITQLAVHNAEPFSNLSPEERDLRNRLRARARQLGDRRNSKTGEHGIEHLVVEVAYEHWHRMLFARFLAENNVLMHPDGVPVTLKECEELAPEEGAADGWELASWYAEGMLPQIFRPGSPVFELRLSPEKVHELERLLADLPPGVFTASDSLGWVYQFWQAKKKEEVNKSGVKIGADELPAVTQLFTEPYMVQFLLHNTLGAWWVGRHGRDSLPIEMPYLRFLDDGTPAAGTFDGWHKSVAEMKILDPCCGSGHFLVAAFDVLVRFRMVEDSIDAAVACDAVLNDNLYGLEVDERCTQIAAFALAIAAWTFPSSGGPRTLPKFNIACSGIAPQAKKNDWVALAGNDIRLRNGMERLYELFQDAPVLGSLIDPVRDPELRMFVAGFDQMSPILEQALLEEQSQSRPANQELIIAAQGVADAAAILSGTYSLVVTNVPYLGHQQQGDCLKPFIKKNHGDARSDLGTAMMDRIFRMLSDGGTQATVSPQNWWFQPTYKDFRRRLLHSYHWSTCVALGEEAWVTFGERGPRATLTAISRKAGRADGHQVAMIDAQGFPTIEEKQREIANGAIVWRTQDELIRNPDSRIAFESMGGRVLLSQYCKALQGIKTGDDDRLSRKWWELPWPSTTWRFMRTSVGGSQRGDGYLLAVNWIDDGALVARRQGVAAWGKRGVAISQMRYLPSSQFDGELFDSNVAAIVPLDPVNLPAVYAFCTSQEYRDTVRAIDQAPKVTNATLVKVPFDLDHWRKIAASRSSAGPSAPYSADPTQWIFEGTVISSTDSLQVAVARLLGYRWPEQKNDGLGELIDEDGIACIPAVRGEQPAASRLKRLLSFAFGNRWSANKQDELLANAARKGWTLERWLHERFFQSHCKLFQHRPFIWHIWDGLKKDGFGALVNYHKLNRNLLETLTYNYLGDWIRRQQDDEKRGVDGAGDRLVAAKALQDKLKLILKGEPPCDIFVRWKPIEKQPMGWEPDINDGVRVNIRPFMLVGDVGKKGAGILREKPNINWNKDRGTDPSDAPWYELGLEYGGKKGDRINEHHLTLAEKQTARDAVGGGS